MRKYFFMIPAVLVLGAGIFIIQTFLFSGKILNKNSGERDLTSYQPLFYYTSSQQSKTEIFGFRDGVMKSLFSLNEENPFRAFAFGGSLIINDATVFESSGKLSRRRIGDGTLGLPSPNENFFAWVDGKSLEKEARQLRIFNRNFESFAIDLPARESGYWRVARWSLDERFIYLTPYDDPHNACDEQILIVDVALRAVEPWALSDQKVCVLNVGSDGSVLGVIQEDVTGNKFIYWIFSEKNTTQKLELDLPDLGLLPPNAFSSDHRYFVYWDGESEDENTMIIFDREQKQSLQSLPNVRFLGWAGNQAYFASVNEPRLTLLRWDAQRNKLTSLKDFPNGELGLFEHSDIGLPSEDLNEEQASTVPFEYELSTGVGKPNDFFMRSTRL